mgnify:CR=1 FL=1
MPAIDYGEWTPEISEDVFVAPNAWVIGRVALAAQSSVFFGAVLRGDINLIQVGKGTNIQEHCLLHTSHGLGDCIVGDHCTIGHGAIVHGCKIGDLSLIGMGATILDDALIGNECIIGANSLVTQNSVIPDGSLCFGSPAKVVRQLNDDERGSLRDSARSYIEHAGEFIKIFSEMD